MNQYTILGRLRLMTELGEGGERDALPYCAAAMAQLLPKLKPSASREDPRLDRAAAAEALCMLLLRGENEDGDGIESFKAGDIAVTRQGKAAAKERMAWATKERDAAFADIAQLLQDTGFQVKTARVK